MENTEKERLEIGYLSGVRFKKNPIFYYWFDDKDNCWYAALSRDGTEDNIYSNILFRGYTQEGLFGNIDSLIKNMYYSLIGANEDDNNISEMGCYYFFKDYFDLSSKTITKKIYPAYYNDIVNGYKTFEFRKNEEDYQVGDILILKEWSVTEYTGRKLECVITYVIKGQELNNIYPNCIDSDYCILGIKIK